MTINLDVLQDICSLAAKQVQDLYPDVELLFVPHQMGKLAEVVKLGEHGMMKHPAGKTTIEILEKNKHHSLTGFLGLAIDRKTKMFGLASSESILAIINVNMDEFTSPKDLRRAVYHHAWHAIDLVDIRKRPEYKSKFKSGPMVPKRSPMNLARLNLQADVFSAVMSGLQGEEDAIDVLAAQRAMDALRPVHSRRAQDYPFVIAMEAAKFGFEKLIEMKPTRIKYLYYARQLALEVGYTFDETSIRQWWGFSQPAQDMAWRNQPGEVILGSAIVSAEDSYIRATGHLVSDIIGLIPNESAHLLPHYNAYAPKEHNLGLHKELMIKAFDDALVLGVSEDNGWPLVAAAAKQNQSLTEGVVLGWCANALYAAARAFDSALASGRNAAQAARMEFEGSKDSTSWETLEKLGDDIIEQRRRGEKVSLDMILTICQSDKELATVQSAIGVTKRLQGQAKQEPVLKTSSGDNMTLTEHMNRRSSDSKLKE